MPSWRDTTPLPVQDDLDRIVGVAIDAAQGLLQANGEFFPFGITITDSGEVGLGAADPALGEHPDSQSVLDTLYAGVAQSRERYRAAAFVADIRADGGDGIRVQAEHRDGGPGIEVVARYEKKRFRRGVEMGSMSAGAGPRRVWMAD
jgi:hypothetical protein